MEKVDESRLISVFDMLITRLSDVEKKIDMLFTACTVRLTPLTQRWIEFFEANSIVCRRTHCYIPTEISNRSFQLYNPANIDQVITVIVNPSKNTSYEEQRDFVETLRCTVPLPFLVVDSQPVFPRSQHCVVDIEWERATCNQYIVLGIMVTNNQKGKVVSFAKINGEEIPRLIWNDDGVPTTMLTKKNECFVIDIAGTKQLKFSAKDHFTGYWRY